MRTEKQETVEACVQDFYQYVRVVLCKFEY